MPPRGCDGCSALLTWQAADSSLGAASWGRNLTVVSLERTREWNRAGRIRVCIPQGYNLCAVFGVELAGRRLNCRLLRHLRGVVQARGDCCAERQQNAKCDSNLFSHSDTPGTQSGFLGAGTACTSVGCLARVTLAMRWISGLLQWCKPSAEALFANKTPATAANAINLVRMTTFSPLKSDTSQTWT